MSNFRYVPKSEYAIAQQDVLDLIHLVQDEVRKDFTFQYEFIGSVARNIVTMDESSNIGYDFDINLYVNDDDENYSPQEIRDILRRGFDKFNRMFSYDYTEDSTRVLTIKVKDKKHSRILHSVDFAIVYDCDDGRRQYIRFNKKRQEYQWVYQDEPYQVEERIRLIKDNGLWQAVRDRYLEKKNDNPMQKKSRTLFAETINDIYTKYFNYSE